MFCNLVCRDMLYQFKLTYIVVFKLNQLNTCSPKENCSMVVSGVKICWEMTFSLEVRALQGLFYFILTHKIKICSMKLSTFLLHY